MDARRLPANRGVFWLLGGFALFQRNPPLLTLLTFTYLLLVVLINLIPAIGPFLLPLVLPLLTVMLGNACRSIERKGAYRPQELLRDVAERQRAIIQLGGLHLLASALIVLASTVLGLDLRLNENLSNEQLQDLAADLGMFLILSIPLLMAFWFAPLLTLWDKVPAAKSVFFSFVASWRNWRAFAMYGLAICIVGIMLPGLILVIASAISSTLVTVASVILRMMMMFVLAPSLIASMYLSYQDVFQTAAPESVVLPSETASSA
jgi:hypothetical protein